MKHFLFFIYQFVFISIIIVTFYLSDEFINKPFTHVDLIAVVIVFISVMLIFSLIDKVNKRLHDIHLLNKILFSLLAFVLGFIFVGILFVKFKIF
ncbi:hypothetical protein AM592_01860 [Bacillus gobiensis]|uniref:Uncharacterized protein n=2 Tax=Bacillus TaxID=1386 RepID=A0A0M4FHE5_9BACI|nr:hypothetical protein AM592_01860 [Bacillus gobiensis]MBP1083529.1 uncharacterized membrane protein YhaH (DUF805 family) [Bacillus capparidis]